MRNIQNLVIDLGGVLYAIDPQRAVQRFLMLHPEGDAVDPSAWIGKHQFMFDELEAGLISPNAFRDYLRVEGGISGTDAEIDAAWNALLLGVMPGRAEDLRRLAGHYRLILLSNTNLIHQQALKEECAELFAPFERLFFSYDMGLRKPSPSIYLQALSEMRMEPSLSLFIDDNLENVKGAEAAGMLGHYLPAHSQTEWDLLMAQLIDKVV